MSEANQLWEFNSSHIQSFRYPFIGPEGAHSQSTFAPGLDAAQQPSAELARRQELTAAIAAAHQKGVEEGKAQSASAAVQSIAQQNSAVTAALVDFAKQREDYFRKVEAEVVRLALSIARRILHREAQVDPLLLAGVVRVALDQMQSGSRVTLRTSPESFELWRRCCAERLSGERVVDVVSDASLPGPGCILEAEVGSTEISLEKQLGEIEGAFFDLLERTPGGEP